jgi:hypothetical protein
MKDKVEVYTPAEIEAVVALGWARSELRHKTPREAGNIILALAYKIKEERILASMCPEHGDKRG